jgi:hypothetical protein
MKGKHILFCVLACTLPDFLLAQPAPPDYSELKYWAASPHKADASDHIPVFLKDEKRELLADVFFIYPTIYDNDSDTASWNAWLNNDKLNDEIDKTTILLQASVFNGSCRVFAPRYRQANMEVFYKMGTPRATEAFDLAWSDLKTAFQYYLKNENKGRPIVIAGHSQGALHAIRLLKEFFDGSPLQKQLVCAYIPGYKIQAGYFNSIPVGEKPEQTGCFVTWRSFAKGEISKRVEAEKDKAVCVNPLNWTISEEWVPQEFHKGFYLGSDYNNPQTISAGIEPVHHVLWVEISSEIMNGLEHKKDLHVYDINLFWMNIRENVKLRINEWIKGNSTE